MIDIETDWLKRWATFSPMSVALKDGETGLEYSYRDLYYLSCKLALHLRESFGVAAGDRVAVLASNEIEFFPLFFAVQRLGASLVPINFRLAGPEIEHVLKDSSPNVLIAQSAFQSLIQTLSPKHVPDKRWAFDGAQNSLQSVISAFLKNPARTELESAAEFEKPCMILYTSGTTGSPKGAVITPKMMFWNSISTGLRLNLTQNDVIVSFLPFFHTSGWNVLNTPFLHRGGKIVFLKKFDADKVLLASAREKATILFGVPTTMDMMSHSKYFETVDLSSIRYAIVGGEPMPVELIKTWQSKDVAIRQGFGLTEFGPNVFSLPEADSIRKIGSIGFANFYIDLRVVDDEGKDVLPGEIGELLLRGPACTPGYWNNEAATSAAIQDGWFHTGDLVRCDDEGYFYVAGRKKDMFISGGENVYPVEIERVLSTHPKVREVAVVGVFDEKWGEVGKAFVALVDGVNMTQEEVTAHCAANLAKYKVPKHIEFRLELPKGDSGKILKRALKDA